MNNEMSNTRTQLTKNLYLDEYVPVVLYERYPENVLKGFIDERLVLSDQKLRDRYGRVTINNWFVGGNRNHSGIRTPDSKYYSSGSQHSWGRASDKIFDDVYAEEVQNDIQKNELWKMLGIFGLEIGVSWVHTDVRWTYTGKLLTFNK